MGPGSLFLLVAAHLVLLLQVSEERSDNSSLIYKAAVVEYSAPLGITLDTKEAHYKHNVETFARITKRAAELDCDIVVFPEQGLQSIDMPRLEDGSPAILTRIPAPEEMVNPCTNDSSGLYKDLRELSCAARNNSIYVVVNVAEMVPCSSLKGRCGCPSAAKCPASYRPCPRSDTFVYNSNVAFDREGTVIARYRKYHLHGEFPLVQTAEPEYSVFDTDFGVRFGMFISFDISFQDPATKLVTDLGARDIVFSTAWLSELPFQTAVQYQAAWSHAMDVNFLASGYNYPEYGTGGSGIYAGRMGTLVAVVPQVRSNYLLVSTLVKKQTPCYSQFIQLLPKGLVIPLPSEAGEEPAPPFEYDRDYPVGLPAAAPSSHAQAAPREFTPRVEQPVKEVFAINDLHTSPKGQYPDEALEALEMREDEERFRTEDEEEAKFQGAQSEDYEESGSSEFEDEDSFSYEDVEPPKAVDAKARTPEVVDAKAQTPEAVDAKAQTPEAVDAKAHTPEALNGKAQTPEAVDDKAQTPEALDGKAQTPEAVDAKAQTPEAVDAKAQTPEAVDAKAQTPETLDGKAQTAGTDDAEAQAPELSEVHDDDVEHLKGSEEVSEHMEDEHGEVIEHVVIDSHPEEETKYFPVDGESFHVEGVSLEVPSVTEETLDVEANLPHPCTDELHISHHANKWLPIYVYPKNAIGSGLHINRERLENFSTFILTSENMKENSTVRMCHGTFCCDFDFILHSGIENTNDNLSPHYHYRLVAFDGVRNMNEFGEGRYQVCGVIPCKDESLETCGQVIKDPNVDVNYTRFRKLHIRGTFKSNNTIVGANTVAHNLLPLPASRFNYVSETVSEDELNVKMESTVPDLTFLTFGIYARNYDADDFRINKVLCEV